MALVVSGVFGGGKKKGSNVKPMIPKNEAELANAIAMINGKG